MKSHRWQTAHLQVLSQVTTHTVCSTSWSWLLTDRWKTADCWIIGLLKHCKQIHRVLFCCISDKSNHSCRQINQDWRIHTHPHTQTGNHWSETWWHAFDNGEMYCNLFVISHKSVWKSGPLVVLSDFSCNFSCPQINEQNTTVFINYNFTVGEKQPM